MRGYGNLLIVKHNLNCALAQSARSFSSKSVCFRTMPTYAQLPCIVWCMAVSVLGQVFFIYEGAFGGFLSTLVRDE